jgi:hypothetical protein
MFDIALEAGETSIIFIRAGAAAAGRAAAPVGARTFRRSMRHARRALRRAASRAAAVETSNEIFNEAVRRSVADIYMLNTDTPEGPYPLRGRAVVLHRIRARRADHRLRDALARPRPRPWCLAVPRRQPGGRDHRPESDAEPGKILHEVRRGEMAETGEVPFRRYYGSIDCDAALRDAGGRLPRDVPAIFTRSAISGRTSPMRSAGWSAMATATATDFSNTGA